MRLKNIFAVSGKARHGKDQCGQFLYQKLTERGYEVLIMHNADLLKFICKQYFKWDENKDEAGRHILQYVGTDVVRAQEPDYWVNFIISFINLFKDNFDYIIIPDCRFPNEIDAFKHHDLPITHIRIIRENFDNGLTLEQQNHISETALDNVKPDILIRNNDTLKELQITVDCICEEFLN